MDADAVTCGSGSRSTSNDSNRTSKSAPESMKTSCNCCWFVAVLIAANILLDLCCVAVAAYALVNVQHMPSPDGMVTATEVTGDNNNISVQMLFEDVNTTRHRLRILTKRVSILYNSIMTPGSYSYKL